MAQIYLYEYDFLEFPLEKLDQEEEDKDTEPSEPRDYLAEWRTVVDI